MGLSNIQLCNHCIYFRICGISIMMLMDYLLFTEFSVCYGYFRKFQVTWPSSLVLIGSLAMMLLFACKHKHMDFTVWWGTIICKIVEVGCPTSVTLKPGTGEIPLHFSNDPKGSLRCINHRQSNHHSAFDKPVNCTGKHTDRVQLTLKSGILQSWAERPRISTNFQFIPYINLIKVNFSRQNQYEDKIATPARRPWWGWLGGRK
jgi:hypothetical protein